MNAIGLTHYLPISDDASLLDVELPPPSAGPHDLVVRVQAVSVNPVDTKVRAPKPGVEVAPRVLGWDAAGEVIEVGPQVRGFAIGDHVYYAGDITRSGCNAQLHAVDARIVGRMPETLDFADAAALPLTTLTAWEALFESMGISQTGADAGKTILIIGGAGGVGSMAIQLARQLAKLEVIATASRPESSEWARRLGAHAVIDHREPLDHGLAALERGAGVDYILCLNSTEQHWDAMCRAIAPRGTIASIVEVERPLDIGLLKRKSARFAWEFMFTRSMYQTPDIGVQGEILDRVAALVDAGTIRGTANLRLSPICAQTLRSAHELLESGRAIGKLVITGWA